MKTSLLHLELLAFLVLLVACGQGQTEIKPPGIRYGETECLECRMIINDARFTAGYTYEVSKRRYEGVPFDDIGDMLIYADKHPEHQVVAYWVHDFMTEEWIRAQDAFYVFSHNLETPMASGTAALDTREKAEGLAAEYQGEVLDWDGLLAKHRAGDLAVSLVDETAIGGGGTSIYLHEMMHGLSDGQALVTLGETDAAGYHLTLLAHVPLHTGHNRLMLHLANPDGETVTFADVAFSPLMKMPERVHTAPVEQPDAQAHMNEHFGGAIGFPMPSGPDLGHWELGVTFSDPISGVKAQASFPIEVAPSGLSNSFIASDDESKLFLMIVSPQEASVGLQTIEILAVKQESALEWPPEDGLTLEITPEMPTMGHGSPNNENPTFIGDGHYRGKVNFTMTGPWTVTVKASRGDTQIGEIGFEFDVK